MGIVYRKLEIMTWSNLRMLLQQRKVPKVIVTVVGTHLCNILH